MSNKIAQLKKGLGKRRCAQVSEFYDDGFVIEVTLASNDHSDLWEHFAGEYTMPEIIGLAKQFIDDGGHLEERY